MAKTGSIRRKIAEFAQYINGSLTTNSGEDKVAASRRISNDIVSMITDMSDFANMRDDEVYEQLYAWEPDIGGAIDRVSTLVGQSFQGFVIRDNDNVTDEKEQNMLKDAKEIAENQEYSQWFETLSELLLIYGNAYLLKNNDLSFSIMPNRLITLVDNTERVGNLGSIKLMTDGKYMVLNEDATEEIDRVVYTRNKFIHIKYKDTPLFITDIRGRRTFGMYSISPMHRAVLSIWWKRQTTAIDIMWRWRNVPREHHKINGEMFSLDKYEGTLSERRIAATAAAQAYIDAYLEDLKTQVPDNGYVTLDGVEITMIDPKTGYMQTNELIKQLKEEVYTALNVPPSIVNGQGAGSYASELVISNYVSAKVIQIGKRIKPILLENMRERLKQIDQTYPVEKLDIKLELQLATSLLETYRELAIMGKLGIYTVDELRKFSGFGSLPEGMEDKLVTATNHTRTSLNNVEASALEQGGMTDNPDYPETATSLDAHSRDDGQELYRED